MKTYTTPNTTQALSTLWTRDIAEIDHRVFVKGIPEAFGQAVVEALDPGDLPLSSPSGALIRQFRADWRDQGHALVWTKPFGHYVCNDPGLASVTPTGASLSQAYPFVREGAAAVAWAALEAFVERYNKAIAAKAQEAA